MARGSRGQRKGVLTGLIDYPSGCAQHSFRHGNHGALYWRWLFLSDSGWFARRFKRSLLFSRGYKREGHEAYAVTLSGLDELPGRQAGSGLKTHIADVVELLTWK